MKVFRSVLGDRSLDKLIMITVTNRKRQVVGSAKGMIGESDAMETLSLWT